LFDHGAGDRGILFQPFGNGGLEGIEFARARPLCGPLRRRIQIFPDGVPAHAEMAFDFTDGPALRPVQAMQVVDLFGGEHGPITFYPAESESTPERCCWQDSDCGPRRGGSASRTQTCAGAELLLARCSRFTPTSQTCAADCFRSKAELLLARLRSLRL